VVVTMNVYLLITLTCSWCSLKNVKSSIRNFININFCSEKLPSGAKKKQARHQNAFMLFLASFPANKVMTCMWKCVCGDINMQNEVKSNQQRHVTWRLLKKRQELKLLDGLRDQG